MSLCGSGHLRVMINVTAALLPALRRLAAGASHAVGASPPSRLKHADFPSDGLKMPLNKNQMM